MSQALKDRYLKRLEEFQKAPADLTKFRAELSELRGGITDVRLHNGQVQGLGADGKWYNYAPDMDVVYIRDAAGNPLPSQKYDSVIEEMRDLGLVRHGGEVRVIEDKMRAVAEKFGVDSDEYLEALKQNIRLRESLEAAHLSGDEFVVSMMPDGTFVRGDTIEELLSGRVVTDGL